MSQLIPSGVTADTSADFPLASGESVTIGIFAAAAVAFYDDTRAEIQRKASNGQYYTVKNGVLGKEYGEHVISGPGTFRVVKRASAVAFGVDKD